MSTLIYIFTHILLPVFMQVCLGYVMQKNFSLDIKSFVKAQIYIFMPSLMFYNVYFNELTGAVITRVMMFVMGLFALLLILSTLTAKASGLEKPRAKAFVNACVLINEGNYGIPLITLLYAAGSQAGHAVSIQMMVTLATSILINTVGLYNASSGTYSAFEALRNIFRLPLIYVIVAGFLMRGFSLELWDPLASTVSILSKAVVPLALFILGAQLAETKVRVTDPMVYAANGFRLILSPLLAVGLAKAMGLEGVLAQVLIIGASFPSAVNSVILAIEFDGDCHYASQTVFHSTILSAFTVTGVIALVLRFI